MKTIYLMKNNTWKAFQYETLEDLKEEFKERNIEIGQGTILSNGLRVQNGIRVGNNIRVGMEGIIDDNIVEQILGSGNQKSDSNYSFMSVATFNLLNRL